MEKAGCGVFYTETLGLELFVLGGAGIWGQSQGLWIRAVEGTERNAGGRGPVAGRAQGPPKSGPGNTCVSPFIRTVAGGK